MQTGNVKGEKGENRGNAPHGIKNKKKMMFYMLNCYFKFFFFLQILPYMSVTVIFHTKNNIATFYKNQDWI